MILIVDDHINAGDALARLLRFNGDDARAVTGGVEALAVLNQHKPTLLILDVNMPDMDGLTVLRIVKEREELKGIHVLIYSADPQSKTRVEAKRLGACDFLEKGSVAVESLVARIHELSRAPRLVPPSHDR